jgi:hypothetical protein
MCFRQRAAKKNSLGERGAQAYSQHPQATQTSSPRYRNIYIREQPSTCWPGTIRPDQEGKIMAAATHYVMDLYYPEERQPARFRREVLRIDAEHNLAAIAEALRIDGWRKSSHYRVRAIKNSSRSSDEVLFESTPIDASRPGASSDGASETSVIHLPGSLV